MENFPLWQKLQFDDNEEAAVVEYFPNGHRSHLSSPTLSVKRPAAHAKQLAEPETKALLEMLKTFKNFSLYTGS
jgi:hypothetical protein